MKIQQGLGALGTMIQESIVGAKVVRAFAREELRSGEILKQAKKIRSGNKGQIKLLGLQQPE